MMSTTDFGALRAAWQETQVLPNLRLEAHAREARREAREVEEMVERLRFSGWLNSLRELVARREEEAYEAWRRAAQVERGF